jgi:hypothetical protein
VRSDLSGLNKKEAVAETLPPFSFQSRATAMIGPPRPR